MNNENNCSDCGSIMEIGFIPDDSHLSFRQSFWHPGLPQNDTFLGMDAGITFTEKPTPVTTYRCSKCGLLKQYAFSSKEAEN